MDADSDEGIIKRKASYIAGVWDDVHTVKSLILSGLQSKPMRLFCP